MYVNIVKPVYDWILAFFALIILSPLLFIIAILIKIDSPGPVFFLQERLGRNGKVFKIVKFRSMVNRPDNFMFGKPLQANDPKITKMGSFVRKTSIDEIPQLINILKGDMSFIGPRPPVVLYPKKMPVKLR
jgi:lipopolysaccharide/colanic/teichoic acid biosynthesis glycosyltransferase